MNFLMVIGSFGISAAVLAWATSAGHLSEGVTAFFSIVLIISGIIYPFYAAYLGRLSNSKLIETDSGSKEIEAVEKATKALDAAKKALDERKKL